MIKELFVYVDYEKNKGDETRTKTFRFELSIFGWLDFVAQMEDCEREVLHEFLGYYMVDLYSNGY